MFGISLVLGVRKTSRAPGDLLITSLFGLLFLAFALQSKFAIGERHILPLYPFALLIAGGIWEHARRSRIAIAVVVLALALNAADALRYAPDYLAYFNFMVKPANSWHLLTDSNLDWGQGLLSLRDYQQKHPDEQLHLAYFGSVDPTLYGIKAKPLPPGQPLAGKVVIGATCLSGQALDDPAGYRWLWPYRPERTLDHSMWIYDASRHAPRHDAQSTTLARGRADRVPLKLDDISEVANHELRVVSAGIDVELVGNAAGLQQLVQRLRALLEAIVVIVADIEINLHALEAGGRIILGEVEDVVAIEIPAIEGRAVDVAQEAPGRAWRAGSKIVRQLRNKRGHLRADRGKLVRISEGQTQRTIATHGNTGNAAGGASAFRAILLLHLRHEFLLQKIFVARLAILRVEVETVAAAGRENNEIADFALAAKIGHDVPSAEVEQRLLVVAQSMQVIQHRVASGFVLIEVGRKIGAVAYRTGQHLRLDDRALGPSLSVQQRRSQ